MEKEDLQIHDKRRVIVYLGLAQKTFLKTLALSFHCFFFNLFLAPRGT